MVGTVINPVVMFTLASVTQRCPSNGSTTSNSLWYTSLWCLVLRCELGVLCRWSCHTSGDWMCIRGSILFEATSHWPNPRVGCKSTENCLPHIIVLSRDNGFANGPAIWWRSCSCEVEGWHEKNLLQKRQLCQPALWLGGPGMFGGIYVARGLTDFPQWTLEGCQCWCRHISAWVGSNLHWLITITLQQRYSEWMWSRWERWCKLLFCVDAQGSALLNWILTGKYS